MMGRGAVPGCILLDLHLPDVQGLEAVTAMLTTAPGAPVVVLTGLADRAPAWPPSPQVRRTT